MKQKSAFFKPVFALLLCIALQFNAKAQNNHESLPFNTPDFFGQCDSIVTWMYMNNQWEVGTVFAFTIDNDGYLQEWRWRDKDNKIINRIKYTRNALHNTTLLETEFDPGTGLVASGKIDIAYEANNRISTETMQVYYMNIWMNSQRFTYTYDANGNMTKKVKERWESNQWVVKDESVFTYDANNRVTDGILSSLSAGVWTEQNRYIFTYDAAGNLASRVEQRNSSSTPNWENYRRNTYTYDAGNFKILELTENYVSNAWENAELDSSFSDGTSITYTWNNNTWEPESKQECATVTTPTAPSAPSNLTVAGKKKKDEAKMELRWQDNSDNELGFIIYRSRDNSMWNTIDSVGANVTTYIDSLLAYETTYYYRVAAYNATGTSDFSNTESATTFAGIADLKNGIINLSVYPNPCSANLTIMANLKQAETVQICISDITGKQISAAENCKQGENLIQINTSALPEGIYFISLSSNHISYTQKIVIAR